MRRSGKVKELGRHTKERLCCLSQSVHNLTYGKPTVWTIEYVKGVCSFIFAFKASSNKEKRVEKDGKRFSTCEAGFVSCA